MSQNDITDGVLKNYDNTKPRWASNLNDRAEKKKTTKLTVADNDTNREV